MYIYIYIYIYICVCVCVCVCVYIHIYHLIRRTKYGRFFFHINLIIYLGYLISLMMYTSYAGDYLIKTSLVDTVNYCPILLSPTEKNNKTIINHYVMVRLRLGLGVSMSL